MKYEQLSLEEKVIVSVRAASPYWTEYIMENGYEWQVTIMYDDSPYLVDKGQEGLYFFVKNASKYASLKEAKRDLKGAYKKLKELLEERSIKLPIQSFC